GGPTSRGTRHCDRQRSTRSGSSGGFICDGFTRFRADRAPSRWYRSANRLRPVYGKGKQGADRSAGRFGCRCRGSLPASPAREKADKLSLLEQPEWQTHADGFLENSQGVWHSGKDQQKVNTSCSKALICNASSGKRRGSSRGANDAWSFKHFDHGNLYPRHAGTPERDIQKLSSARLIRV